MAGKVFFSVSMSLDGFIAPEPIWPARPPVTATSASPTAVRTILEHLNAGLVDEFSITLSPVLFGAGTRLFDGVGASRIALEPVPSEPSSRVTHLTYAVHPR
ncbi:dihydrofolate reductase family protein [Streptomyces sp. NPDC048253]|uniref:dihydrofolate reductase family protein n=1 Tax=Streptomyces sp. NPDC048253 TaxID=3365524 RepID=UPI00371630C0